MSRPICFVLDGRPIELGDAPASTMLLDWLRTEARLTGTKEGCAEGDCGACTVAIARHDVDGAVRVEPCNACILPLASVDGCGVLTVEGLGGTHPVQRAMVEHHGSQCGFCTPGFVVAMVASLARGPVTSHAQACDALAGNLCRCTGYRPIIDALRDASDTLHPARATTDCLEPTRSAVGLPAWIAALPARSAEPLAFAAGGVQWHAPRTIEAVDALLAEVRRALAPGGLFLWTTPGPGTTTEHGGTPVLIDMHDLGTALGYAGFVEPVLDIDRFVIHDAPQQAARTADGAHMDAVIREVIHIAAFSGGARRQADTGSDGANETLVPLAAIGRRDRSVQ